MANYTDEREGSLLSSAVVSIVNVLRYCANQTSNALSFAGAIHYIIGNFLVEGTVNLGATIDRLINITIPNLSSSLSFSKVISRTINLLTRTYSGAVSFVGTAIGTIGGQTAVDVLGSLSLSGLVTKSFTAAARTLSGVISFIGEVYNGFWTWGILYVGGTISQIKVVKYLLNQTLNAVSFVGVAVGTLGDIFHPYVDGSLAFAKSLTRVINKLTRTFSGNLNLAGEAKGRKGTGILGWDVPIYSALRFVGAIVKVKVSNEWIIYKGRSVRLFGQIRKILGPVRTLSGAVTFVKELSWYKGTEPPIIRRWFRYPVGVLNFLGSARPGLHRAKSGVLNFAGAILRTINNLTRGVSGTASFTGEAYGWKTGEPRLWWWDALGTLTLTATLTWKALVSHTCAGVLSLKGALTQFRSTAKTKGGALTMKGRCYPDKIIETLYYGVANP